MLLTKQWVQFNALISVAYRHIELHQFSITRRAVTVQLSIRWVSFDGFSIELNCCWIIT